MTLDQRTQQISWEEIWDARIEGLSGILGAPGENVLHAAVPFKFRDAGGAADVVPFPNFVAGHTYVTAELTEPHSEQQRSSLGCYELMLCAREALDSGAFFISNLASFTCTAVLEPGEIMDVDDYFEDDTLCAVLFTHPTDAPARFNMFGQACGLLLCLGITAEELAFAEEYGSDRLLAALKQQGVFPYTVPGRATVQLPV